MLLPPKPGNYMNLFKKKAVVEFYSVKEPLTFAYPIEPINTVKTPWVGELVRSRAEKIRNNEDVSARVTGACSGIQEIMNTGYVVRAPNDFKIITDGNGYSFNWETPSNTNPPIKFFAPYMFGDYAPMPPQTLKTLIKVDLPWRVKMLKGWRLLVVPINYGEQQPFTAATGILDTSISGELNAILYWHVLEGETIVKAGTPLYQIIPIQDNDAFDFIVRSPTQEELKLDAISRYLPDTTWGRIPHKAFKNVREKFFGKKKRCPFHNIL
jgi:hypothetical protein